MHGGFAFGAYLGRVLSEPPPPESTAWRGRLVQGGTSKQAAEVERSRTRALKRSKAPGVSSRGGKGKPRTPVRPRPTAATSSCGIPPAAKRAQAQNSRQQAHACDVSGAASVAPLPGSLEGLASGPMLGGGGNTAAGPQQRQLQLLQDLPQELLPLVFRHLNKRDLRALRGASSWARGAVAQHVASMRLHLGRCHSLNSATPTQYRAFKRGLTSVVQRFEAVTELTISAGDEPELLLALAARAGELQRLRNLTLVSGTTTLRLVG